MCGFVGFTGQMENREAVLKKMMDRIEHRGPDMFGTFVQDEVALGFRRLSILDLSEAGAQPMHALGGKVHMVFNGEIYNFRELREQLRTHGHSFSTESDSEVLIMAYVQWGEAVVERLRGMYAFLIWDERSNTIFGARDIFGIKPFYYCQNKDGNMLFGSEIKSFLDHPGFEKQLNRDALRPYLTFQYSATEETFFKGVYKLPAAHCLRWQAGKCTIWPYRSLTYAPQGGDTLAERAKALNEVVCESVKAHSVANVPVGSFLSGGIDSSYITATLMPQKTFSVGFADQGFNETNEAGELSEILGVENHRKLITPEECFGALSDIQYHMDEPQSNPSSVPLYFLAQMAREHVTVVLSGEGADELFAGYEWYIGTPAIRKFKRIPRPLRRAMGAVAHALPEMKGRNFLVKCAERPEYHFVGQAMVYTDQEAMALLKPTCRGGKSAMSICAPYYAKVKDADELTKMQYLDLHLWLPGDILLKADKMCMAHSLELRVPFLDREVLDFAQALPTDYRMRGEESKTVLRRASEVVLPEEWVKRPKRGFPVPIRHWFRDERFAGLARRYFEADYAAEFFDTAQLIKLLDEHQAGVHDYGRKIWTVLVFLVWYERFFVRES